MATLRCKKCGGELNIVDAENSICVCEYCGSKETIPTIDNEKIMKLYDRANRLRMDSEFDKASSIYESIIEESDTEAEAYWGIVLCKYGIEYVDDPATGEKVPTCHRLSFDSVIEDPDFEMVMENADITSRIVYRDNAKQIEDIRRGIIEVSEKEEPYDIFICYKETDANGDRTIDSVMAQNVYDILTGKGYRVFFSRITLEDKLGQEYEPYIFAALNSAKIMLAFGTSYDYYNAVWVKNEWSRFLKLMAKDKSKKMIPCYKDIDAYDIPKEFKHLQAQDMGKIGAEQDLVRGIDKILRPESNAQSTAAPMQNAMSAIDIQTAIANAVASNSGNNTTALLQRGNIAVEDGEWDNADKYFEDALNANAQCAEAYWGKLKAHYKCRNNAEVINYYCKLYDDVELETIEAFPEDTARKEKAINSFAIEEYLSSYEIGKLYAYDRTYKSELAGRKEQKSKVLAELAEDKYLRRARQYATDNIKQEIDKVLSDITAELDRRIAAAQASDENSEASKKIEYAMFLDRTDIKAKGMFDAAEERRAMRYRQCVMQIKAAKTIQDLEDVSLRLEAMHGYSDTNELAKKCRDAALNLRREEQIREEEEREKKRIRAEKRIKKIKGIIFAFIAFIIIGAAVTVSMIYYFIPESKYKKALAYRDDNNYQAARDIFAELEYKDSAEQVQNIWYMEGCFNIESENYDTAIECFEKLSDVDKSEEMVSETKYLWAMQLRDSDDFGAAINLFSEISDYKDSLEQIREMKYIQAMQLRYEGIFYVAINLFNEIADYNDSLEQIKETKYLQAMQWRAEGKFYEAIERFNEIADYSDSSEQMKEIYELLLAKAEVGDHIFLGNYLETEIEWRVLDKNDDKMLLISEYALEKMNHSDKAIGITWNDSNVKKWLNGDFINHAFDYNQQQLILPAGHGDDNEFLFLLSENEVLKYFPTPESRITTDGIYLTQWSLRDFCKRGLNVKYVEFDGTINSKGLSVAYKRGIRPAMWVNITGNHSEEGN